MKSAKLLAIDLGASGGKAVLGEFTGGKLETRELRRFPNGMVDVHGRKHWPVLRLLEEVKECLRAAPPELASAAVDTWGVDYGYVGADGDLLGVPFAYRDGRNAPAAERVHRRLPSERLYAVNGLQFMPFNTVYQVADDLESRPWLVEKADRLLLMPDLLGFLLTRRAVAEYTIASTTGLLDARSRQWSPEILAAIGFPAAKLAPLAAPGETRAALTAEVARETGSRAEIVFPAGHDTGSAVAAVPASGDDWAFLSSGTWFLVGAEVPSPILSAEARARNFTNEGGVAGTIRFLKNVTGLWILEELRRGWGRSGQELDWTTIALEATRGKPLAALINPDDPAFTAPADMAAAVHEFCRRTGQTPPEGVGPTARCVFESLALACRRTLGILGSLTGKRIRKLHVVGGGCRNELLCRMLADACRLPVYAGPAEATAAGNLLVQAMSLGLVGSLAEGRKLVAASAQMREYLPSADGAGAWDAAAGRFERLCS
ncbi:MAG TPA: rhamnulokinase family protein [Planctomycetota bacterium]|nr:rhamnulokinase family protein [Planctomycetota bacterium]